MAGNYESERKSAYNDINNNGTSIQIIQSSSLGTFDPITETYARGSTLSTIDHVAVIVGYEEEFIDDRMIKKGDKKFLIPAVLSDLSTLLTLTQDDKIYFQNKYWKIINVDSVEPAGVAILFKVQGRH